MLKAKVTIKDALNSVNNRILLLEANIKELELKLELEKKDLQDKKEQAKQLEEVIKIISS